MRQLLWIASLCPLVGCGAVAGILGVEAPTGSLDRVDLISSPPLEDLLAYECPDVFGASTCSSVLGAAPAETDLLFSFDLVFNVDNPNDGVPIPLVDLLLATTVYDDTNLGAVCMSFCDPDDDSCVPTQDAAGACEADNSRQVDEPGDLVPTVDQLLALSADIADGGVDNGDWRVLNGGESSELHFGFDLQPDTMLSLSGNILDDAVNDLVSGRNVRVNIPYSMDGTLFFDAPDLGRYGLGFGPFDDTWLLQLN